MRLNDGSIARSVARSVARSHCSCLPYLEIQSRGTRLNRWQPCNTLLRGTRLTRPPRPAAHDGRRAAFEVISRMDWRHRVILTKLAGGCAYLESASAAGVSRISVWNWCQSSPVFKAVAAPPRETGKDERTFRMWLRHPFRGCRPPTGKGHGGKPRFSYGRM